MMKRQRIIAVSVTTRAAMDLCLEENVALFCIENPLYTQLYPNLPIEIMSEYRMDVFEEKQVILLTKVRGKNRFDEIRYVPFYLPLTWENWHS